MIEKENQRLFALACFFRYDLSPEGDVATPSFTIITRDPYDGIINHTGHDRSPVILSLEDMDEWLDPNTPSLEKLPLLSKTPTDKFRIWPVDSKAVGKRMQSATTPTGQFIITDL